MSLIDDATSKYPNIQTSPWSWAGSPSNATPNWAGTTAYSTDGTDDEGDASGERPFADGTEKGSMNLTLSSTTSSGFIMGQRGGTPNSFIYLYWDTNYRIWLHVQTSSGNYIRAVTANNTFSSGVIANLTATFDLRAGQKICRLYKDGTETGYSAQSEVGSTANTITTGSDISLGYDNGGLGGRHTGHLEFPMFWDDRVLTPAEGSTLYNTDLPAYGVSGESPSALEKLMMLVD